MLNWLVEFESLEMGAGFGCSQCVTSEGLNYLRFAPLIPKSAVACEAVNTMDQQPGPTLFHVDTCFAQNANNVPPFL